jgi:flagella basal body P-ring formation protein FlgA
MNKVLWISLLIGLFILIPVIALGESNQITIVTLEIPDTVTVNGPKLFLNDLGMVRGGQTSASGYLKLVDLGAAPAPGQLRIFNREYLNSIIRQYNLPVTVNLQMGEQLVVKSIAACIKGAEIEKVIQNLVAEKKPNFTNKWVELHNIPEMLWLTRGEWKIEAFPVGKLPEVGTALFKVVLTKGKENKTLNISGKIRATAMVYQAVRDISRQVVINQIDFVLIERELLSGKEFVGEMPHQIRSTKVVKQGEILRIDWFQPIPLVGKDHQVKVIVKDQNVIIDIIGVAKVDGWLGDEVLIINPASTKTFRAKVTGNGIAEVNLQ